MNNFNKINHHLSFCRGPMVHIWSEELQWYLLEIYESFVGDWSLVQYTCMRPFTWYNYFAKQTRNKFRVKILGMINDEIVTLVDHTYNDTNENVLLRFTTDSYDETKIWAQQAIKFMKENQSNVTVQSRFADRLLIDFPDSKVIFTKDANLNWFESLDFYASYDIGKFHILKTPLGEWGASQGIYSNHTRPQVSSHHKTDWIGLSSEEIFNDIMNL